MNLTEQEAATRMCCRPSGKVLRDNGQCVASACMAWRWKTRGVYVTPEDGSEAHYVYHSTGRGFCGLAGGSTPTDATHDVDGNPL